MIWINLDIYLDLPDLQLPKVNPKCGSLRPALRFSPEKGAGRRVRNTVGWKWWVKCCLGGGVTSGYLINLEMSYIHFLKNS